MQASSLKAGLWALGLTAILLVVGLLPVFLAEGGDGGGNGNFVIRTSAAGKSCLALSPCDGGATAPAGTCPLTTTDDCMQEGALWRWTEAGLVSVPTGALLVPDTSGKAVAAMPNVPTQAGGPRVPKQSPLLWLRNAREEGVEAGVRLWNPSEDQVPAAHSGAFLTHQTTPNGETTVAWVSAVDRDQNTPASTLFLDYSLQAIPNKALFAPNLPAPPLQTQAYFADSGDAT